MKKRDFMTELRDRTVPELRERAGKIAEELMKLRFRKAASQLEQTHQLGQLRRNLARINTLIRHKGAQGEQTPTAQT